MIVALESIRECFEGVIPSPVATCALDGTPNVSYMSMVRYVDAERIALTRQFLNKTRANLDVNPHAQARVVDPQSLDEYVLDLRYLHTETDGPLFDGMRASLEAIAEQSGMSEIFRLRGVDVYRVLECRSAHAGDAGPVRRREIDAVAALDELTRRLEQCESYDDATCVALQALEDLFGVRHSILFAADERGDRLFAVVENGYPHDAAGAEVAIDSGLIGIAVARRRVLCDPNLARSAIMGAAVRATAMGALPGVDADQAGGVIPLPSLAGAKSAAAVPLLARGVLTGLLYLESDQSGRFGASHERLLRVIGAQVATTLALLEAQPGQAPEPAPAAAPATAAAEPTTVTYYQADDSVFVGGEYVIRGVPGRILWRLLSCHAADGRCTFSNRELRLDERLGLPAGADNLEARLLVLRRRLAATDTPIALERVGRGRLELRVAGPLALSEIATTGPMRAAHAYKENGTSA